jgi:hypothetical protein
VWKCEREGGWEGHWPPASAAGYGGGGGVPHWVGGHHLCDCWGGQPHRGKGRGLSVLCHPGGLAKLLACWVAYRMRLCGVSRHQHHTPYEMPNAAFSSSLCLSLFPLCCCTYAQTPYPTPLLGHPFPTLFCPPPQVTQYSHGSVDLLHITASHPAHQQYDFKVSRTYHQPFHIYTRPPSPPAPPLPPPLCR